MPTPQPARRYRFGIFEADAATGELRRKGMRVRIHAQPFQVLLLLLHRPGEPLTREDIARDLWPDGTFVDFDHGVNSAVNRLREALDDKAANPRFIETLPRRGYRFIAPVELIADPEPLSSIPSKLSSRSISELSSPSGSELSFRSTSELSSRSSSELSSPSSSELSSPSSSELSSRSAAEGSASPTTTAGPTLLNRLLATPADLPHTPHRTVQTLFLALQLMYLGFYIGALSNLTEIDDLLSPLSFSTTAFNTLITTAAILIPARAFLFCAALFHAPGIERKFLRTWPLLLLFDWLWSLAPFLLLHHIPYGLALACTTLLVYSPFAQRSLILMGAAQPAIAPAAQS